jgi:hypothetical protein
MSALSSFMSAAGSASTIDVASDVERVVKKQSRGQFF